MNALQNALMKGLATEVLEQTYPEIPLLDGSIVALSNYGLDKYDAGLSYTNYSMTANFIREQDAPFLVTEYGTVQIIEEPRPNFYPIFLEGCKVSFNHTAFKKMERQGTIIDWYKAQLTAKVKAWDEKLANVILFGVPSIGVPGLLQGSGIPLITSNVNLSTAPVDTVINEVIRIALSVSANTLNVYRPNKIGIPQDLFTILNTRSFSSTGATTETLLQVILARLATSPAYNKPGDKQWEITAVPQFNTNKLMTVLPDDPELIGAAVFNLDSFYSPDNSESANDTEEMLASAHEGGYMGIIAKRPSSGVIVTLTY